MIRTIIMAKHFIVSLPRTRGDDPYGTTWQHLQQLFAPHSRG